MLRSWRGPLNQNAVTGAPGLTAILLFVPSLLIGGPPRACAAPPAYTLAARVRAGYRPEISVRVNGVGPFWCTLDSGAGRDFVVDTAIGKAAGLRPTSLGRSFGEGPDSNVDEITSGATLQVDKLRLPHQRIRMHSVEDGCIFGTKLLDRFVVEIDYLTPEIRLFAADGYLPPTRAVKLPLAFDGTGRPMVATRLLLQARDELTAQLLLDTAVAEYALSLSKVFTDKQQILKRVRSVIRPPFQAHSGGNIDLLATRIARLSLGSIGVSNPVVILFRTASAAPGSLPDGLLGSGFLHRFLMAIDVPGASLYLTPNRTYDDPAPQWWWSAALPLLPARQ